MTKLGSALWAIGAIGLVVATAISIATRPSPAAASESQNHTRTPVLVELYTSEGCSSCPPADEVLLALERDQSVEGAEIVPLAFHVDYWNDIGWPDPFSQPEHTARQRAMAAALGENGVYTPEAVVDGRAALVGSRRADLEREIARAAAAPHASVRVRMVSAGSVEVTTGALPPGAGQAELTIAVVDARASVRVLRGENAGRTLEHSAIVRAIATAGEPSATGSVRVVSLPHAPPPNGPRRCVAFVTERGTRRVLGVGTTSL